MNIVKCTRCGGEVTSCSIGWICKRCGGLVDMQGVYHRYVDSPYIPPQTNYDRIRAMSIEEMASFLSDIKGCGSCFKRGNNCFPMGFEEWLTSEIAEEG